MTFANTSHINLKVLLDSKDRAKELIREFVKAHLKDCSQMTDWVKEKMKNSNVRHQYFGLAKFYQQNIVPYFEKKMMDEAEQEVAQKWRAAGKEPYYRSVRTGAMDEAEGFRPEVNKLIEKRKETHKEYWRATAEQTRLSSADAIAHRTGVNPESELPSGLDLPSEDDLPGNDNPQPETPRPKPNKPPRDKNEKKPSPDRKPCPWCNGRLSTEWKKGKNGKKYYCSRNCYFWTFEEEPKDDKSPPPPPKDTPQNPFQSLINEAIGKIRTALYDEEPVVNPRELRKRFWNCLNQSFFNGFYAPHLIENLRDEVLAEIDQIRQTKKRDEGPQGPDQRDPVKDYKNKFLMELAEIMAQKDVALEELEAANQNYSEEVSRASSSDQIDNIASRILRNINKVYEAKHKDQSSTNNLNNLRQEAINYIHQELKRKPELSGSDISRPNWETDLTNATEESQIVSIRDSILTEIKTKREAKKAEAVVVELISKGQTVSNNFEELSKVITQLGNYAATSAYQAHKTEIEELETRLQALNPSQYKQQTKTDLEKAVQSQGINLSQTSKDTQAKVRKANQTGLLVDKNLAKEAIYQDAAQINLDKLIAQAEAALNDPKISKLEKEELAKKVETFIKQDDFKKKAFLKKTAQVNALLNQLRGVKQQTQKPVDNNSTWPKVVGIGALVVVPVILVGVALSAKRKKNRG